MTERLKDVALIGDMRDLIASGDLVLADERAKFRRVTGRDTMIDDEKLIVALAATDDDDEDLFVANVEKVEKGELTT